MNINNQKKELLLEIREHTIDCDSNRAQHFNLYNRYIAKIKIIHSLEAASLFILLLFYIVFATWSDLQSIQWINIIPAGLSIFAICVQMFDYYANYSDKANQHWYAAQTYSRLYRECQFFPAHYANMPVGEITRTLHDICNELHDLNLLSPNLDKRSYIETIDALDNKTYPVDRLLKKLDTEGFNRIIDYIKYSFKKHSIEIYVYGSYINKLLYNDIDIVIIIYGPKDEDLADLKIVEVESLFKEIPLDITVFFEEDLDSIELIPLLKNVQSGTCLYRSPEITEGLQTRVLARPNYASVIEHYYNNLRNTENTSESFWENAYFSYYYIIASLLDSKGRTWDGESSLLFEFKKLSSKNDYNDILNTFLFLRKKRLKASVSSNPSSEFREKTLAQINDYLSDKK